ncbi:MAG: hypothetical protein ACRCZF_04795 [Gemmataceae bacterium]
MTPWPTLALVLLPWNEAQLAQFVTVQLGELPIIISAPHGGRGTVPGVATRDGAEGATKFVTATDINTDMVAEQTAAELAKLLGKKPHLVIARFERKFADVNRPVKDSFESPPMAPIYDRYHSALGAARATVQREFGRGILIDIHGHSVDRNLTYRGTNNGKSVTHLLDRFGRAALTGPKSILGQLDAKGYKSFPALDSMDQEYARLNGGHIVQTYGSNPRVGGSVDAIQLELGGATRTRTTLPKFSKDLAAAIAAFAEEYLPPPKK